MSRGYIDGSKPSSHFKMWNFHRISIWWILIFSPTSIFASYLKLILYQEAIDERIMISRPPWQMQQASHRPGRSNSPTTWYFPCYSINWYFPYYCTMWYFSFRWAPKVSMHVYFGIYTYHAQIKYAYFSMYTYSRRWHVSEHTQSLDTSFNTLVSLDKKYMYILAFIK
jgi:hypothetical protein